MQPVKAVPLNRQSIRLPIAEGFSTCVLGGGYLFGIAEIPDWLKPRAAQFEAMWEMHPAEFHLIQIHGRMVKTPRWQQAYGRDYHYSGGINKASPIPSILEAFLGWARENVALELNGLLVNWYDGLLGHYIGPHRDSPKNLLQNSPIVTISLGEERIFRLRPWSTRKGNEVIDIPARNGTVFMLPWDTNRSFTHQIVRSKRNTGRRISITLRAFE
jgi:alkylated DNA repair dioxygenase AlkB